MNNNIRKATHADTDCLAISLARAFDDDPFINWLVRKDNKRAHGMERMFHTCLTELCLRHNNVFTTEDFTGGALWYPPGTSEISYARQLTLAHKMIPAVGLTGLLRLALAMEQISRRHSKEKYYYLQFIGTVPEARGKGLGAALLKPILDICDREKCGARLENTKESNIAFYRRFGFNVIEKFFPGKGSPPLWLMGRSPESEIKSSSTLSSPS
jgi:ribosomal protein S18 acetylase RimI-like enzyme